MIQATLRTNYFVSRQDSARAQNVLSFKLNPRADRRTSAAAAEVRDLRVLAPGRGRAPAVRLRRPRRAALVGPARGLPHRDPRSGQGAGGQERRHRAGRRQGRVRRQAAAAAPPATPPPTATRSATRASPATSCSSPGCSTSPTTSTRPPARSSPRRTWCDATATTPTWWSRPTRAPRPSPTSPTKSPSPTGSGSVTRSPPAGRWATTTRRWASPPRARGSASSGTSARWAWTPRPRTSPSSASAT